MPYVRTRLGRLFYEESGAALRPGDPAIVLLHGLLFDGGMWRLAVEPLSALGRVLVLDGPGHGKSETPPRFTLEDHADALFDAFGDLRVERAVVAGLSWGGMVAMRFALQHPRQTAALALLDTSAEREKWVNRLRFRAFLALYLRIGVPRALFDSQFAPMMYSRKTIRERPELVNETFDRLAGFGREGVGRASAAVAVTRTPILASLSRIGAPTLVICGTEDYLTPPICSENIAKSIPGARLIMIEGAAHLSTLEKPTAVNDALVPFVSRHVQYR